MKRVTRTLATVVAALSLSFGVVAISAPAHAADTSWGTGGIKAPAPVNTGS